MAGVSILFEHNLDFAPHINLIVVLLLSLTYTSPLTTPALLLRAHSVC